MEFGRAKPFQGCVKEQKFDDNYPVNFQKKLSSLERRRLAEQRVRWWKRARQSDKKRKKRGIREI